jgi:hypothetical protein
LKAKCICPNAAEYSYMHKVCVGPCPAGYHFEDGSKDCVIDEADCKDGTKQVSGPKGDPTEGHCVCPEGQTMINGKCDTCDTYSPKTEFKPDLQDLDNSEPPLRDPNGKYIDSEVEAYVKWRNRNGICQCPDGKRYSESKKKCFKCPEIVDGEAPWIEDDNAGDCKKRLHGWYDMGTK